MKFEIGKKYDTVVNGQIWSFTFDGADPEDEDIYFITWSTGEEEAHSKDELLPGIQEMGTLRAAGTVYPRGISDEEQYQALRSVMTQPTYRFAGSGSPGYGIDLQFCTGRIQGQVQRGIYGVCIRSGKASSGYLLSRSECKSAGLGYVSASCVRRDAD